MSAVRRIRQNNPDITFATIRLRDEPSDAELAQALAQNEHINEIILEFQGVDAASSWGNLIRVLATRETLRSMMLEDEEDEDMAGRAPHAALTGRFLQAMQQNRNVINVVLNEPFLSGETLAHFLDSATHLTSFYYTEYESRNTEDDVLAAALQRNTNLQTLGLNVLSNEQNFSILQGLRSNTALNSLQICMVDPDESSAVAVKNLLESTNSIQSFELEYGFDADDSSFHFGNIAQGLINSRNVTEVIFRDSEFGRSEETMRHFNDILRSKTNLHSLAIFQCDFGQGVFVPDSLVAYLLKPSSPLKKLELVSIPLWTAPKLRQLLHAVERSTLEHLFIGGLARTDLGILQRSIPAFKLKHLVLKFRWAWLVEPAEKQALIQAVKRNFNLRSVDPQMPTSNYRNESLFDDEQKQLLQVYFSRNEQLAEWIENPASVPRHLWPEALTLAMEAGEGSLFGSLRTVLGSDYGSSISSKRKRKRPQHYTSS